jgi:hypothetical protein
MINDLNDDNFIMYAIKAYEKPNCVMSEFDEDIKRIKYVKRLIKKYVVTGDLKERLILNHIIILSNMFGIEATVRMLFFKLDKTQYPILKTFLLFLNHMPNIVYGINGNNIISADISIDIKVGNKLSLI